MAWGKVDDKLHASVKWRRASKGARALWTTALSWCSDQENDGHVPADMLRTLDGTKAEAANLVAAGLWDEADEGWVFHDWADYNPDGASKKAKREAESVGGKRGNHVRWHVREGIKVEGCEFCTPDSGTRSGGDQVGESGANPPVPTRPVPTRTTSVRGADPTPDPSPQPEFTNINGLLATYGLTEAERAEFVAWVKAKPGVRSHSAVINAWHRKGEMKGELEDWRLERDASNVRPLKGGKRLPDVGVQEWMLRG